jgi:CRISPR-associated endonuclease Csn1
MEFKVALDIGVASVGWAIVQNDLKVVDSGARLFDSADPSKNVERRDNRGTRRLLRRKAHRLTVFDRFWVGKGLDSMDEITENSLILRNKAIIERIDIKEVYCVLRNMLKHRGISYLDDAIDDNVKGAYKEALNNNALELKVKFPCEIQLERFNEFGKFRGDVIIELDKKEQRALSNVFTKSGYRREIEQFFEVQGAYYPFMDETFITEYMDIFESKRDYYVGPGNEKSRTDYGRFTTKIDTETGKYITEDNIFEKLIGKCSVYNDELRASSASFTAQEFNVLNDLNNLTVNGRELEEDEKRKIIKSIFTAKSMRMRKFITEAIGEPIIDMKGARIDGKDKEIFHTFEAYREIKKALNTIDVDINDLSLESMNLSAHILTINTEKDAIIKAFAKTDMHLANEVVECFIKTRKKTPQLFNKWHSLSLKIMNELIDELYKRPVNQMVLLTEMGLFKDNIEKFKGLLKIPVDSVLEELYNPVVRKAVRQSIEVLNAIMKTYGQPTDIIIEMARDKNEEDQKKRIKKIQGDNEKELAKIIKKISLEYGVDIEQKHYHQNKGLKTKLRLWNEQGGVCLYSGKPIVIADLLYDSEKFEIDHVIPISISFDDSRKNKVLVYRSENQTKGNRTPYMYLSTVSREWDFERYAYHISELEKKKLITTYKKRNLLFKENITKQDVVKGFIQRNLNDTRYASRVVLNCVQDYMRANDKPTKVKVIRGSFTSQLRKRLNLPKDRDESYAHHAVDAMIMCYSLMGLDAYKSSQKDVIDYETGEILDQKVYDKLSEEELYNRYMFYMRLMEIKLAIKKGEERIKYSHKVDKKVNRKLSNETIYGVREKIDGTKQKISKINNIYDINGYVNFKNKKDKNKLNDFLMYHHDPKTFEKLLKILEEYADQPNPFLTYKQEIGEPIRKYSKKDNGPFINSLKYYDGEVGSCIDISHKYGHEKGSKKVVLDSLSPYRTDVYYREEDKSYHLVGIKYANFKFMKGEYILDEESYNEILVSEKLLKSGECYTDIEKLGYEFRFSLYKNDIILYEKNGEEKIERFLSRTMPKVKNYIETKPIDANKFSKQNPVGLGKTTNVVKINTDILGNKHFSQKEKFIIKFKLDR